ncbi:bifunctional apoptosis regulator-like isoform X3 [Festucalex cinctus]
MSTSLLSFTDYSISFEFAGGTSANCKRTTTSPVGGGTVSPQNAWTEFTISQPGRTGRRPLPIAVFQERPNLGARLLLPLLLRCPGEPHHLDLRPQLLPPLSGPVVGVLSQERVSRVPPEVGGLSQSQHTAEATDKLFSEAVQRRRAEIHDNPKITRILLAFERYGDNLGKSRTKQYKVVGFVFSAVFAVLLSVAVSLLLYQWSSSHEVEQEDQLVSQSVVQWTPEEMIFWLEHLGPGLSSKSFQPGSPDDRMLMLLEEKELLKPPYHVQNQAYRDAILTGLYRLQTLERRPQNLWEYKAANSGKSLFLLYAMKRSPRLTLFYLYLFDYSETFLPFLHTCCPSIALASQPVESLPSNAQTEPNWQQWSEFMVKYFLLPYLLIAEFAWHWLSVHYWSSCFVIVHAVLLSMLECCSLWRLWTTARIRTLPAMMWNHVWTNLSQGIAFGLMWPLMPQLVCNCFFYWALYVSPLMNIDLLVHQLRHPGTAMH